MLKQTLYEILGVEITATQDEIKKAYRQMSKDHHPDKMGDSSKQAEINNAYEVLSDPMRRKRYDETGQEKDLERNAKIQQFFSTIFLRLIEQSEDPGKIDLINQGIECVDALLEDCSDNLKGVRKSLNKYSRAIEKLKTRGDKNLIMIIQRQIDGCTQSINAEEENIEFIKEMRELISDYDFEFEKQPDRNPFSPLSYRDSGIGSFSDEDLKNLFGNKFGR